MNHPYMPSSTAKWLIENTALTFEQIAEFCGLHELEVKSIADSEFSKVQGLDPVHTCQLAKEDIENCEKDPALRLTLLKGITDEQKAAGKKFKYTPIMHRQNRGGGILWLLKNYPELSDTNIAKLMRSTKTTVSLMRSKTHKSYAETEITNPVVLGLVSGSVLQEMVAKARKKAGIVVAEAE
ncbi:MAG: DUF1013 domain-containing protein [Rickettsiales bacterium]|jgi:hypothetical protein|nr:DUF1013 domain-containing protein [Rickettsiales bacterium]